MGVFASSVDSTIENDHDPRKATQSLVNQTFLNEIVMVVALLWGAAH